MKSENNKPVLSLEIVLQLRAEYKSMQNSGAKTGTYIKIQTRLLGVSETTIYHAINGRSTYGKGEYAIE